MADKSFANYTAVAAYIYTHGTTGQIIFKEGNNCGFRSRSKKLRKKENKGRRTVF